MIPGWLCSAEGRLAVFDRRDRAEYDHLFQSGPIGDLPLSSQHAGVTFPLEQIRGKLGLPAAIDHQSLHNGEQTRAAANAVV